MSEEKWEFVDEVAGDLQAEIIKGLLEAQGIPVWLSQEGAGRAYGIGVGSLGRVQILVPTSYITQARTIMDQYYGGEFDTKAGYREDVDDREEDPDQG